MRSHFRSSKRIFCLAFNNLSLLSSSFLLRFQICSQLSTRLEKQQAATKEELDAVRVRGDLSLFGGRWNRHSIRQSEILVQHSSHG